MLEFREIFVSLRRKSGNIATFSSQDLLYAAKKKFLLKAIFCRR